MAKHLKWAKNSMLLLLGVAACKTAQDGATTKDFVTKTVSGGVTIFYNHVETPDTNPVKYICLADCDASLGQAMTNGTVGLLDPGQRYCGAATSTCLLKAKFYNLWFDPTIGLSQVASESSKIDQILDKTQTVTDPTITDWQNRVNAAFGRFATAVRAQQVSALAFSADEEQAVIKKLDPANTANLDKVRQQIAEEKERLAKIAADAAAAKAKADADAAAAQAAAVQAAADAQAKADAAAAAAALKAQQDADAKAAAAAAAAEQVRQAAAAQAAIEAAQKAADAQKALLQLVELQGTLPALGEHPACKKADQPLLGSVGTRSAGTPSLGTFQMSADDSACLVDLLAGSHGFTVSPTPQSDPGAVLSCPPFAPCTLTVSRAPFYSLAGTLEYEAEAQTPDMKGIYFGLNLRAINNIKTFCTAEQAAPGIPRACVTCMDSGDHITYLCQALVRMPRSDYTEPNPDAQAQ